MRPRGLAPIWARVLLSLVGLVVVLLVLAQLILPRLAESHIRSRVSRYGKVLSVSVSAWPAVELLWGDVDSVSVRAAHLSVSPQQVASLLWEGRGASRMHVSAQSVSLGSLQLTQASFEQQGSQLSAHALASEAGVKAALPEDFDVQLLRSGEGKVEVAASGALFGISATVKAIAGAVEGKLVAHPLGLLIEGFQLTLFSNPHVYVQSVGASIAREAPLTYKLTMNARLR